MNKERKKKRKILKATGRHERKQEANEKSLKSKKKKSGKKEEWNRKRGNSREIKANGCSERKKEREKERKKEE